MQLEDEEEKQEATVGLADANEISVDAAVVAHSGMALHIKRGAKDSTQGFSLTR